jgi:hypothetical protein
MVDIKEEIWKCVDGTKGAQVSSHGRVMSARGRVLKLQPHKGYLRAFLSYGKATRVHRLVAHAFISNPLGLSDVNHINGDKSDNRVENLEWATRGENVRHAYKTGLAVNKSGEQSSRAILTQDQVNYIKAVHRGRHPEFGQSALGRKFGVSNSCIWRVVHGDNWVAPI